VSGEAGRLQETGYSDVMYRPSGGGCSGRWRKEGLGKLVGGEEN